MNTLYARSVFFVNDARRAHRFYTERLGFTLDWTNERVAPDDERLSVLQVSLMGFELILNQVYGETSGHAGHGRLFIGLEDDQAEAFREHLSSRGVTGRARDWGRPTLVINDLDGNELFFWLPRDDFSGVEAPSSATR